MRLATVGLFALIACAAMPAWAGTAADYRVVDRIAGADGGWDYAAVDPVRRRLYVARSEWVMGIDLATGHPVDQFAKVQHAHMVLPIDGGRTLVETDGATGLVRFLDASSGEAVAEVSTGKKPDFAYLDKATGLIVVMNPGSDAIALIDPATHAPVRMITVKGGLEAGGGDGHGHAFVNLEQANALAEVDLNAGKLLRTIPLTGCEGPTGLAMIAGGTRVLSACDNGVATLVDAASGKLVQTLPVGHGPDAVILDEARSLAFVPAGDDGTLTAISLADPAHLAVVATIPTQAGARTGALDPRTGRIYLPTAVALPPEAGEKRRRFKSGSFVVLVVAPPGE